MSDKKNTSSRSWFCVLNNPEKLFGNNLAPQEIVQKAIDIWCSKPTRTCALNYEIGDNGTPHMHMVLEDSNKVRFTTVQKLFEGIHIEPTKGTKQDAEDYIYKRGKFEEKKHTIIVEPVFQGEIKSNQGKRSDLEAVRELIEQGLSPNEIFELNINFRKYESIIKKEFFYKRKKETPLHREVTVYWHVGESGCGKSFSYVQLCEKYGENEVYLLNDYDNGGFDNYNAERVLFLDEFKGNFAFSTLLTLLDSYRIQIHCRYSNSYALWNEVHITSIFPPESVYEFMVEPSRRDTDRITQLLRRIDKIIYHYKTVAGEYATYEMDAKDYVNYEQLKQAVLESNTFKAINSLPDYEQLNIPFETEQEAR